MEKCNTQHEAAFLGLNELIKLFEELERSKFLLSYPKKAKYYERKVGTLTNLK
jgi:hypothetical protein